MSYHTLHEVCLTVILSRRDKIVLQSERIMISSRLCLLLGGNEVLALYVTLITGV